MNLDTDYCIRLLEKLVNIPSTSGHEGEIMLFLERELSRQGLNPRLMDLEPGRPNILCSLGTGFPRICLNAHADTVHPSGASVPQAKIDGDIMRGLGTCDDKASIAAMVTAFSYLAANQDRLTGRVDLLISVDEEDGGRGVESVIESGYTCDYAIVGEPTNLDIVHAHSGVLFLTLSATGASAHGSTPALGKNAIWRMTDLVREIEKAVTCFSAHPAVGPPSLNLGEIHAGDRPNRVPDRCLARVDIRVVPPADVSRVIREVEKVLADKDWASYEIERRWEPLDTPIDSALVKAILQAGDSVGVKPELIGWRGATEAEPFSTRLGAQAIVTGPGDLSQAHSSDEYVSIPQTQQAAQLYAESVIQLQQA